MARGGCTMSLRQRLLLLLSLTVAAAVAAVSWTVLLRIRHVFEQRAQEETAPFLREAAGMAQDAQLDFPEIVGPDGNVVSSAQWPARFGYPEPAAAQAGQPSFLKREELPDNSTALGVFAVRTIDGAQPPVRLVGGQR